MIIAMFQKSIGGFWNVHGNISHIDPYAWRSFWFNSTFLGIPLHVIPLHIAILTNKEIHRIGYIYLFSKPKRWHYDFDFNF